MLGPPGMRTKRITTKIVGGTEEDVRDGVRWRQMIQCGDALREQLRNKEVVTQVTGYRCIFMIIYCRPSQEWVLCNKMNSGFQQA